MESDELDRLASLPLFPLATVLFPGAVLPLHIFEERYKEMMRYALEHGGQFGLIYRGDAEVGKETVPDLGSVGCVAKVSGVMPLEEGRMNLISIGRVRFRVLEIRQLAPFLIADVQPFGDEEEPEADLTQLFADVRQAAREFLIAAQMIEEDGAPLDQNLPDDPEAYSLLIASVLPIDNDEKQKLLEMTSTRLRLTRLRHMITAALAQYHKQARIQEIAKSNGHARLN